MPYYKFNFVSQHGELYVKADNKEDGLTLAYKSYEHLPCKEWDKKFIPAQYDDLFPIFAEETTKDDIEIDNDCDIKDIVVEDF